MECRTKMPAAVRDAVVEAQGAIPDDFVVPNPSELTPTMDPELRFSRAFRPHLPEGLGEVLTRATLLEQARALSPDADQDDLLTFLYMVNAWGYGTSGYGHARTTKIAGDEQFVDAARTAIGVLASGESMAPVTAYYLLNNRSALHVTGWGPAFFTKFLAFADPANQPDTTMKRAPAMILDRWTAAAAQASLPRQFHRQVSRRRPLGSFAQSGWTTAQYAYYLALIERLRRRAPFTARPFEARAMNVERGLFHYYRGRR